MSDLALAVAPKKFAASLREPRPLPEVRDPETEKPCFRTEKSYVCREECDRRRECRRIVAEWLRR